MVNHSASCLLGELTSLRNVARGWVLCRQGRGDQRRSCQLRAAFGSCGSTAVSFSAGTLAGRIANRLAGVYHAFGISADRFSQREIWATA